MCLISLLQHVGTYIKLLFHIVATYIKAVIMSGDQFLYGFVQKGHRKACQQSPAQRLWSLGHSSDPGRAK
jgi:hypothetical protein